ncbi:MAG: FG-GAP-like repeat-containing protein [Chitinophagaceae bacterium]
MNTRLLLTLVSSTLLFSDAFSQEQLPAGVSSDWYQQQVAAIEQMHYQFKLVRNSQNWMVNNPTNKLGFIINEKGYQVHPLITPAQDKPWLATFKVQQLNNKAVDFNTNDYLHLKENPSTLLYTSSNMNVEYVNTSAGMRQNFIVHKKSNAGNKLSVAIKVETSLQAEVKTGKQFILKSRHGKKETKLFYDELKVWDGNGKSLAASMEYNPATSLLTITADDANAQYPVTIDPLNRTPEWTTSADGVLPGLLNTLQLQVKTNYGYTVAGLGDINGDGYDDVAVGAPTMADVVTGTGSLTGVGAVFIYYGSATGLSATPDKVLQPSTAVSGALFGYSIAAGDVTGDGLNDIIVGAPLDSYQTTASSLTGATSVTVKAGKVYVYRSEDLSGASNPTPFAQVRLQGTANFSTGIAGVLLSNVSVNALFGLAVSTVKDLNGDGKSDIVVGAPAYLGTSLLAVQSGAAFVYYSNNLNTTTPVQLSTPTPSLLGIASLPIANTNGLLFGFSVDGVGDYNNDGYQDIAVGAPAGVNLNSLGGIFSGQFLGGSAFVYYGNGTGIQTTSNVRLQASASGLLSNAANLFGYKVKGATDAVGQQTGNIIIGAPSGSVLSNVVGGLQVKAGQLHVFKSRTSPATGSFTADQVISSPRASSILSTLAGQTLNVSMLYGASIDNMMDVNCDNVADIIVGEPMSTAVPMVGANVVGGAAYIYLGNTDGTYQATPYWNITPTVSPLLGVNTTALLGWSVAGVGYTKGHSQGVRSLVGGPSNALDFGSGLLNLGNTLGTTLNFVFDNNGLGKTYQFAYSNCTMTTLPVKLTSFTATPVNTTAQVKWIAATEENLNYYQLERSSDGLHFETVAMIFKKEAASDDYNYPDRKPNMPVTYYRLKMVDNDEKYIYSSIVSVKFTQNLTAGIVVAPNPVQADINVRMTGLASGNYRIELRNANGQMFVNKSVLVNQAVQTSTIARNGMAAGLYLVNVYNNSNQLMQSVKIVLQ